MTNAIATGRREALALAAGTAVAAFLPSESVQAAPKSNVVLDLPKAQSSREVPFDNDWRFLRQGGAGLERPDLDDAAWQPVDLPHDWSVEDVPGAKAPAQIGPFDRTAVGRTATGFTLGGEGWYRKHFRVDGFAADAQILLNFGGVYLECDVYLNGRRIGGNLHGYIPFAVDLTPFLDRAGDNVLAVHVRNLGRNSRWYSGSGIYREVTLDVLPTSRIARWGVAAWTRRLSTARAYVDVATTVEKPASDLVLTTRLRDDKGRIVAETRGVTAAAQTKQALEVRAPHLWSPDAPYLYRLESELRRGETVVDRITQPFGLRIFAFDPHRGLTINGKPTKLRGGCIHHDNGLLGARAYRNADERRIRLLKARGYNAVRSAHNPASRSLRETCDKLGMLLIDEAFDAWHVAKEPQDFARHFRDHWEEVIRAMVLPARNSASVLMWSIGNEIPYRATDDGVEWEWKLANAVKRLDPTRPVTAGLNGVLGRAMIPDGRSARPGRAGLVDNASTVFLDVPGYNYRIEDIEREHADHPERVVYASETFPKEVFDYRALSDRAPYFLGEFVWTAMDYIGEAGIGATAQLKTGNPPFYLAGWPWINAWCGDLDLIGQQKAASLARDVAWGLSPLEMTVQRPVADGRFEWVSNWGWPDELASWSWAGSEGKVLSVRIYASCDRVELRLNGTTIAEKSLSPEDKMQARFDVPYAPGTIEAIARKAGRVVARRTLATVGSASKLGLSVERSSGQDGADLLIYVPLDVRDADGHVLPDDQRRVSLTISGPAELLAFGSANPQAVGSLQALESRTYRGRALAILKRKGAGPVRVEARSEGLEAATISAL